MLIRYPGGKGKLRKQIFKHFPYEMTCPLISQSVGWSYHEPFVGSGEMAFALMEDLPSNTKIFLSDIDYHLICLWQSVKNCPDELITKIRSFNPSADKFYEFKEQDGSQDMDPVRAGFQKLALHRMSYSGLGYMAGGPLGGRNQDNDLYRVDCRWNVNRICRNVLRIHNLMSKFDRLNIFTGSFDKNLSKMTSRSFAYLDPPYYVKGPELYKHSMDDDMHLKLRDLLMLSPGHWVLSYDDAPKVRELYSPYCGIADVYAAYSVHSGQKGKTKNREILISPEIRSASVAV